MNILVAKCIACIDRASAKQYRNLLPGGKRARLGRAAQAVAESLERRQLMSTVYWSGAAGNGNWDTPGNWQGGVVPTSSDTAVFESNASNQSINGDGDVVGNVVFNANISFFNFQSSGTILLNAGSGIFNNITLWEDTTLETSSAADTLTVDTDTLTNPYNCILTTAGPGIVKLVDSDPNQQGLDSDSENINVTAGTLEVDSQTNSSITVDSGAKLRGDGTVGQIATYGTGTVSLNESGNPSQLTDTSNAILDSGSTLTEVISHASGSYVNGQLILPTNGPSFYLSGANLAISMGTSNYSPPSLGTVFTVISNQTGTPYTGHFNGLPQGAVIEANPAGHSPVYFQVA